MNNESSDKFQSSHLLQSICISIRADHIPDIMKNMSPQQVLCDPEDGHVYIIHDSRQSSTIGSNSLVTVFTSKLDYLFHFTVYIGNMCGYTLKCCLSGYYFYHLFSDYLSTQVSIFCKHTGDNITSMLLSPSREVITMDVDSVGALYLLTVSYNLFEMFREDSLLILCSNESYQYKETIITSKYLERIETSWLNTLNHVEDIKINRSSLYLLFRNPKFTYMQELNLSGDHLRYFEFDNKLIGVSCFCADPITGGLALISSNSLSERLYILNGSGEIVDWLQLNSFKWCCSFSHCTASVALNLKTNELIRLSSCIHLKCLNEIVKKYCWLTIIDSKLCSPL